MLKSFFILILTLLNVAVGQTTPQLKDVKSLPGIEVIGSSSGAVSSVSNKIKGQLYVGSRRFDLPPVIIWMNYGAALSSNGWAVAEQDAQTVITPLLTSTSAAPQSLRIMLDPGHGGMDGGAESASGKVLEKDITLDIARRTAKLLKKEKHTVALTRRKDRDLTLKERTQAASAFKADIFISIHVNSAVNRNASGIETFVLPVTGAQSTSNGSFATVACAGNNHDIRNTLLGVSVHTAILNETGEVDRGVKRARYEVLRSAPCPAALIETGFLSSKDDAALLVKRRYRQKLATSIAAGIHRYSRYR